MNQRIIFLDIDGPVINTPCYWIDPYAGIERTVMNTQSIGILNEIALSGNAKIVTNSTHNNHNVEGTGRNLKDDLIRWGMKEELFHNDWKTTFPWPDERIDKETDRAFHRRLSAILIWQEKNGEADWIAFDDEPFTTDPRLFYVDFDYGISYNDYLSVKNHWNLQNRLII